MKNLTKEKLMDLLIHAYLAGAFVGASDIYDEEGMVEETAGAYAKCILIELAEEENG